MMREVLGPIQAECLDTIINNYSLLTISSHSAVLSEQLSEYVLLAAGYRVIYSRWDSGDVGINFSKRRFPPELISSLESEYRYCKTESFNFNILSYVILFLYH